MQPAVPVGNTRGADSMLYSVQHAGNVCSSGSSEAMLYSAQQVKNAGDAGNSKAVLHPKRQAGIAGDANGASAELYSFQQARHVGNASSGTAMSHPSRRTESSSAPRGVGPFAMPADSGDFGLCSVSSHRDRLPMSFVRSTLTLPSRQVRKTRTGKGSVAVRPCQCYPPPFSAPTPKGSSRPGFSSDYGHEHVLEGFRRLR